MSGNSGNTGNNGNTETKNFQNRGVSGGCGVFRGGKEPLWLARKGVPSPLGLPPSSPNALYSGGWSVPVSQGLSLRQASPGGTKKERQSALIKGISGAFLLPDTGRTARKQGLALPPGVPAIPGTDAAGPQHAARYQTVQRAFAASQQGARLPPVETIRSGIHVEASCLPVIAGRRLLRKSPRLLRNGTST